MVVVVAWMDAVRLEAFVGGCSSILLELYIISHLWVQRRLLFHYHALPLFSGVMLMLTAVYPDDATLSIGATLSSCITSLNLYNTYYVHVVMLRRFVPEVRLDQGAQAVIADLFLPQYAPAFLPWGAMAQLLYSLLLCTHLMLRSYATALLL